MNRFYRLAFISSFTLAPIFVQQAHARGSKEDGPALTVQGALDEAERRLDSGGSAADIATKLHRTHGLSKDEARRLELIDARCDLLNGQWAISEKILAKFHKATPEDTRLTEWYARALDGDGKGDTALPLFKELANKDELRDGDSYWDLAQLEKKTDPKLALTHARAALDHPIVLQSDELDKEIHDFISDLSKTK